MTIRWVLFVLLSLCITCSSINYYKYTLRDYNTDSIVRDIPITLDVSFDKRDELDISAAIAQWNYVLNGWVYLHVVGHIFIDANELSKHHDGWLFVNALSTDRVVIDADKTMTEPGFWMLAFVNYIGGDKLFMVKERFDQEDFLGLMLHEIGHLLGAKHIKSGLMQPHFDRYSCQCIDKETAEQIAAHEKLPSTTLNYCVLN